MNNLKRLRTDAGLSQSELADRSGINIRIIQYYEQGYRDINKAQAITLYRIAGALGAHIEDLLQL